MAEGKQKSQEKNREEDGKEMEKYLDRCSKFSLKEEVMNTQGGFDGRGQPTASPMLTAIMSGGVGISGRELFKIS